MCTLAKISFTIGVIFCVVELVLGNCGIGGFIIGILFFYGLTKLCDSNIKKGKYNKEHNITEGRNPLDAYEEEFGEIETK